MDDIVLRAMQKWPNVPRVYGWLRLDRRGRWLVKNPSGGFDAISNRGFIEFIGRNYGGDDDGRWFFQNGPQRVFVTLDYTPWVFRLDDAGSGLITHTGQEVKQLQALYLDEEGALLGHSQAGVGLVLDRDLPMVLERLHSENVGLMDQLGDEGQLAQAAGSAHPCTLLLFGQAVPFSGIRSGELPERFGFVPRPVPPEGQADC